MNALGYHSGTNQVTKHQYTTHGKLKFKIFLANKDSWSIRKSVCRFLVKNIKVVCYIWWQIAYHFNYIHIILAANPHVWPYFFLLTGSFKALLFALTRHIKQQIWLLYSKHIPNGQGIQLGPSWQFNYPNRLQTIALKTNAFGFPSASTAQ